MILTPVYCLTGYTGQNCETNINECLTRTCPGSATCFDGIATSYCRCPLKKTGTSCLRGTVSMVTEPSFTNYMG